MGALGQQQQQQQQQQPWQQPWQQQQPRRKAAGRQGGGHAGAKPGAPPQQQHKAINRQITLAAEKGDLQGLLEEVRGHLPKMNGINLATAFHRAAKLAATGHSSDRELERMKEHPVLQDLFQAIVRHILGHSLSSFAKSSQYEAADEMPVQCMSIVTWSCATLQIRHKPMLMAIAEITAKRLGDLKPYELSNLLWAYAKLSLCPSDLLTSVAAHISKRRDGEFKVQCLSTIAWSFATLRRRNTLVFSSIAAELSRHAGEMKPQEISNTLWAFAKSRCASPELFRALGDVAARDSKIWSFKPQELSNTVWAFATVGLQHPVLFSQVESASMHKRHEMVPQNIANILWAFAKLGMQTWSTLFTSLLDVAIQKLHQHKPQEFSAVIWAAAQRCPSHADFFDRAAATCSGRLHEFSPNALANLVKALSVVQMGAPHFFTGILQQCVAQLAHFTSSALCTLFRGATTATMNGSFGSQAQDVERAIGMLCEKLSAHVDELQPNELGDVSATLHMRRCTAAQSGLYEKITQAILQKQDFHKVAVPKTAHSVGSMSTTESQADEEDEAEDQDHMWTSSDDACNGDGASIPVGEHHKPMLGVAVQRPDGSSSSGGSSSAAADEQLPILGAHDAPWVVPLPAPWRAQPLSRSPVPVYDGSLAKPMQATRPLEMEPQRVSLSSSCWEAPTLTSQHKRLSDPERTAGLGLLEPTTAISLDDYLKAANPEEPAIVDAGLLADLLGAAAAEPLPYQHRTLLEWFTERCKAGVPVNTSEAASIARGVLLEAEPLLHRDPGVVSCVQPDDIIMDVNEAPRLRQPATGQPGGWGDALKWLSPEEASGQAGEGAAWAALTFRIGLLLHFLSAGSPEGPYPGKTGEVVLMGLLAELSGSGPPVRPDLAAFGGPDILRRLVAGCLRLGGQAPPARGALAAVLDALSSGVAPQVH